MPELNEPQKAFLRDAHLAVVTTLRSDGSPHSTVVWVDCDGDDAASSTRLAVAPRSAICWPIRASRW